MFNLKMLKKLLYIPLLLFILIFIIYPSQKENTKLFDYCYSLEKILSKNSIQKRRNFSSKLKSISRDITKFGITKTKGVLINKMIDQYKRSKNSFIIDFFPNEFYCLTGYWMEKVNPGIFESIIYEKSKQKINQFKDLKIEVDELLDEFNSEYKIIKKEFDSFF